MLVAKVVLLSWLFIQLTADQLPNPSRYRIDVIRDGSSRLHYAVDRKLGKMSVVGLSTESNASRIGTQDLYIRNDGLTYTFDFKSQSIQCIANRGGPYDYMDYWLEIVKSYGSANVSLEKLVFEEDCTTGCVTWDLEYNSTAIGFTVRNRLYITKINSIPVKLVNKLYDLYTGKWVSTSVIQYVDWNLSKIPASEFDYPMDVKNCYYP